MSFVVTAAALVFAGTYFVLAIGKLPGFRLDRAGTALLGASLMVACGESLAVTLALVILFFAGTSPAKMAILAGALLLLTRIVKSAKIYAAIDWPLLVMFAGLFVVVAGFEKALLSPTIIADVGRLQLARIPVLSIVTAGLSNIVSNVPAVLLLRPFILVLHDSQPARLTVAMASTFAGNLTVLGSVANLIVVQKAAAKGVRITLWDYFKVGATLTLLTLSIGSIWLAP